MPETALKRRRSRPVLSTRRLSRSRVALLSVCPWFTAIIVTGMVVWRTDNHLAAWFQSVVDVLSMGSALYLISYPAREQLRKGSSWYFSFRQTTVLLSGTLLTVLMGYADLYENLGIIETVPGAAPNSQLPITDYLYFSLITWTTVGYGDFIPSRAARLVAASEAVLGYAVMAAVIAVLGAYWAKAIGEHHADDPG